MSVAVSESLRPRPSIHISGAESFYVEKKNSFRRTVILNTAVWIGVFLLCFIVGISFLSFVLFG